MNKKCQIFTPHKYVNLMLDIVGYNKELYGKKILENSCGQGNILAKIVERYIEDCLNKKISKTEIKKGLESDIIAFEIDKNVATKCIEKLDEVALKYKLKNVNWKLIEEDYLFSKIDIKFDFIIGNPPYIKYSSLERESRIKLRNEFVSCKKGKFDYCYPFIEKSLIDLNDKGKFVYLIPSSIFKNVFASELRDLIVTRLTEIYDYRSIQIFDNALTSSAIIYINKDINNDFIIYKDLCYGKTLKIDKQNLFGKWIFEETMTQKNYVKFSDYFTAHISVATLLNKAFVLYSQDSIETEILKPAASPKNLVKGKAEYIIFPYRIINGKTVRISNDIFEKCFPLATSHLMNYQKELNKRNADKNCQWYEYGRSQALNVITQDKLILSTVVTKEVKVYKVNAETVPYSGIFVVKNLKNDEYDLDFAIKILKSKSFFEYINKIGINASGGSLRITVKDINNFDISEFIKKEN